jgi:uncharacterized membrane protein
LNPWKKKMKMRNKILRWFLILASLAVLLIPSTAVFAQPGKFDLTFYITGPYPNNVNAGQTNQVFAVIQNNSNATINNIRFSANAPDGWTVTFNPTGLSSLNGSSSYTVKVDIIPASDASNQNYNVILIAEANETRAVADVFLKVEGGTPFWLWVGIGVAVLALMGFIWVYVRSNRQ